MDMARWAGERKASVLEIGRLRSDGNLAREAPKVTGLSIGALVRGVLGAPLREREAGGRVKGRLVELALHPCPGSCPDGIVLLLCHGGVGGGVTRYQCNGPAAPWQ